LIQLPVKQTVQLRRAAPTLSYSSYSAQPCCASMNECKDLDQCFAGVSESVKALQKQSESIKSELKTQNSLLDCFGESTAARSKSRPAAAAPPKTGTSNAARVSRGTEEDTWTGLAKKDVERDPSQHGTITVTLYYTVVGGVPSTEDVKAAIDDLNQLYAACPSDKKLVDCTEITKELTVKDMQDITTKVTTQGYQPPVKKVQTTGAIAFPE